MISGLTHWHLWVYHPWKYWKKQRFKNSELKQRRQRRRWRKRLLKYEFTLFQNSSLLYSVLFNLSNVGKFFWSWILKAVSELKKAESENRSLTLTSSKRRDNWAVSRRGRATTSKKCTKKRDAREKLLFCQSKPIAFLSFSLPPRRPWLSSLCKFVNSVRSFWTFFRVCYPPHLSKGEVLPIVAYTGRLHPKAIPFQVSGIWKGRDFTHWSKAPAEVYDRVGKSVISVCKKDLKGLTDAFYGCEKEKKISWFGDLFRFKRRCIYSSSKGCSVVN